MVAVLDGEVEFVLVAVMGTAILRAAVGQHAVDAQAVLVEEGGSPGRSATRPRSARSCGHRAWRSRASSGCRSRSAGRSGPRPSACRRSPEYAPRCPDAGRLHGSGRAADFVVENSTKLASAKLASAR